MPHVSRYKLEEQVEEKLLKNFYLILSKINTMNDMEKLLLSLLTPTEQIMVAKRLAMYFLIQEGYSDSEIEKILHITRMTVGKFRYFIESEGNGLVVANSVMQDEKLKQEIKTFLLSLAGYAARAAGGRVKSTIL